MIITTDWHNRFLSLAAHVSQWSKDPSTKVGAVITNGKRIVSIGFNGLPSGVDDDINTLNDRELKYKLIIHAEINAILFANEPIAGCSLYTWPFLPCPTCSSIIIQKQIGMVVAPPLPEHLKQRWKENIELSKQQFKQANVKVLELNDYTSYQEKWFG